MGGLRRLKGPRRRSHLLMEFFLLHRSEVLVVVIMRKSVWFFLIFFGCLLTVILDTGPSPLSITYADVRSSIGLYGSILGCS